MYDSSIKPHYIITTTECLNLTFLGKFCNLLVGKVDISSNMSDTYTYKKGPLFCYFNLVL